MTKGLHVPSEIGKLRKVCLHRPGDELLNLPPDELERLLFDDVPFLEVAQQEHDTFAQILRDQGVEVLYLENLVAGTVQADLPELADLGRHVQTFRHGLLPFFRALLAECISAPLYGTLLADSSSYIQKPPAIPPRPRTVSKVR